jgi:NAD(P)-dependent dehydrogenase (short-subunit alcohol dehydrogenase family)
MGQELLVRAPKARGSTDAAFRLDGKVAVVTGGLGLLGRSHCAALARAGAHVVVADRSGESCRAFAQDLGAEHRADAYGHAVDVTEPESVRELRDATLTRFGRLDVLLNDAALNEKVEDPLAPGEALRFEHYPLDLWQRALAVNLTGTFLCCQALGTEMARQGHGSVINVASTYAMVAPDQSLYRRPDGTQDFYKSPAYPATKAAILALTRYLAAHWGRSGVRVNTLSPGGVENGQEPYFVARYAERTPLGRMASPADYEGAIVFLASDASAYMTGANLVVDGGFTAW